MDPEAAGDLGSLNALVALQVAALGGASIQLVGSWVGTVTFEGTVDGLTYRALNGVPSNGTTAASTATVAGLWFFALPGLRVVRARMSAYTSGTAGVSIKGAKSAPWGGGAITATDGAIATLGTTTDLGVVTDTSGTVIGFLRGLLIKMLVLVAQVLDYDTGAGTASQVGFGLFVAASGGPVGITGDIANGLDVDLTPTNAIFTGKKTVTTAGTRVALASSQAVRSVVIHALAANSGLIYVGDSTVAAANGFQLSAGESVSLDIANLATVNLDSSVNGEGVTYLGIN